MYIESVPNRGSPPCILLRESFRVGGKICKRTLANLTNWPAHVVEGLRRLLKGGQIADTPAEFEITRSLPHGHVLATLGTLRRLDLDKLIATRRCRQRDLAVAMIVARIIAPGSKLALARGLSAETSTDSLAGELGLTDATVKELYEAMDWLLARQDHIEQALANRHLRNGTLILYDVTSTYFEGKTCSLGQLGHSRDDKKDKLQIVFGLLCDADGRPVAVEVFEGNVGDPKTLASQVGRIRGRFALERVVLVGDRGMITDARIREDLRTVEGLDWITALRAPAIRKLMEDGHLQPSLFDQRDLAEIQSPDYPGERLVACRNPLLAEERKRKRQELLAATEKSLAVIAKAVGRAGKPLRGADKIGLRVGKVIGRYKMAKHFRIEISEKSFGYERDGAAIAAEAALDGFYVIRTNVPLPTLDAERTVRAYKGLSRVERAFRCLKTVDLHVRPIHHRLPDRVRAHVLLSVLAYYVEWHMRQALAPILFDDDDKAAGEALQTSPVAPARRSPRAERKAQQKRTDQDEPVHSFQTLLADLATLTKNRIQVKVAGAEPFDKIAQPTALQQRALSLLAVLW